MYNLNIVIMKKYFYLATALVALAACSSNDFFGDQEALNAANGSGAISFNSGSNSITRASGAEAATLLNNNFVIEGIKTVGTDPVSEVFDNYNVNYVANTAATTASNSANWEYVAQSILTGKTDVAEQSIKYWDYAAKQYDYWAYSLGGGTATVSSLNHNATLTSAAYTITGTKTNLSKVYISDLVTAYNPDLTVSGRTAAQKTATEASDMGKEVNLTFRSLMTKVRVGLYETIPGYSVRNVQFYPSAAGSPSSTVVLYASGDVLPAFDGTSNDVEYTVSFPTVGVSNIGKSDYNKAHVAITSDDKASKVEFGTLTYGAHQEGKKEKTGYTATPSESWTNIWVQRSASTCTWATEAGASAGAYSIVLPYETGAVLTLKLDYTLESIDGSGETIVVHGATALIPSQYAQWKSNYAYTYIFKISDNTNGLTNTVNTDKVGLYPITLDAVVVGNEEGTQETITTVATPSITTYSVNSNVITNNEYTTSDDIYVIATTDGTLMSMTDKAVLYDITKSSSAYAGTEAEVLDALTTYTTLSGGTYTGRNSVVLTPVASALGLTIETIPTVDGQTVSVDAGKAALIDKSKLESGHYYAYVFDTSAGDKTTTSKYEAVTVTVGTTVVTNYFTRSGAAEPYTYTQVVAGTNSTAEGKALDGVTYYDKYNEVSGATYGIKVIKVN